MHPRDKEIIRRYEKGATLAAIGTDFGLTESGVAVVLERHGVKRRPRGRALKLAGKWAKA